MEDEVSRIQRLKERNEQAFAELYENYSPMLFGLILRIVDNQSDAENILQDCFVKIWLNIDHYDPQRGRLATWLINIARNCAIDFTRSGYFILRKKIRSEEQLVSGETPDQSTWAMKEEAVGLQQILMELPPTCREVIQWMYYDGMSQAEIAETFGIPLGTVKTRARAALKTLRKIFNL